MIFKFLKYLQPTNYFNCKIKNKHYIFPNPEKLPEDILSQLKRDRSFLSVEAIEYDLSWQAIQKGFIGDVEKIDVFVPIPLEDEYRFVHKYFHSMWSIYCMLLRILSFKNPFLEYRAWLKAKNYTKKSNSHVINEFVNCSLNLIASEPLVSVIIPTLNRYDYLKEVLLDFEKQDYLNFEVIIVDQSDDFNPEFYKNFKLDIKLIRQDEKALWLARNTAIKSAKGELIALSEDDVRIEKDWLSQHLKCMDLFDSDISAGVFYPLGSELPKEKMFYSIAQQFATGNTMLYKKVFSKVGLFDRQFEKQRMGDGAFGLRCFKAGFKSVSNPFASCIDIKAVTGGLRELGSWDAFRPTNWFAPRPVPSVLYYYRRNYGNKQAFYALLKSIPPSIIPYRFKRNKPLLVVGYLIAVILVPILIFQVLRSWSLASKKIKQGPLIDEFN